MTPEEMDVGAATSRMTCQLDLILEMLTEMRRQLETLAEQVVKEDDDPAQ